MERVQVNGIPVGCNQRTESLLLGNGIEESSASLLVLPIRFIWWDTGLMEFSAVPKETKYLF